MIRKHVIVRGTVQGVGFRYWTRAEALRLGVTGWVRNRLDGTVEVEVEGTAEAVEAMLRWLSSGPTSARVEGLDAKDIGPQGDTAFVLM